MISVLTIGSLYWSVSASYQQRDNNVLTKMMISVIMTTILSSKVPFPPDSLGLAPDINGGVTTGEYHRGNPSKTLQKEELPQLFWFEGAIDFTTL